MRIAILALVTSLAVACIPGRHESRSAEAAADKLLHAWVECDRRDDSSCAAQLLHMPPDYRGEDLAKERATVLRSVNIIREHFGGTTLAGPTSSFAMVEVGYSAGTVDYWMRQPPSTKVTYSANFEKAGPGYLQAEVFKVGSEWELRGIHYGLPASSASSTAKIAAVLAALSNRGAPPN